MKLVYYTRHARNRMRLYEIVPDEVIEALAYPSLIQPGEHGRQHAWKTMQTGKTLRITFVEESGRYVVITVTPKRFMPEGSSHEN